MASPPPAPASKATAGAAPTALRKKLRRWGEIPMVFIGFPQAARAATMMNGEEQCGQAPLSVQISRDSQGIAALIYLPLG
jgi:hypothetical protein